MHVDADEGLAALQAGDRHRTEVNPRSVRREGDEFIGRREAEINRTPPSPISVSAPAPPVSVSLPSPPTRIASAESVSSPAPPSSVMPITASTPAFRLQRIVAVLAGDGEPVGGGRLEDAHIRPRPATLT